MLTDFILAALHHVLIFALVAMLVTQSVLLTRPIDSAALKRLAGVDRGYGMVALLLIVIGLSRVFHGVKGEDFYWHNPWFHAKLGAFVLVGILSIWPTVRFIRWRKTMKANAAFLPPPGEVTGLARIVRFELMLVGVIFILAAAMARHGGL